MTNDSPKVTDHAKHYLEEAFGTIRSVRTPASIDAGLVNFTARSFILGLAGFVGGIFLLAVFAVRNWA